MKTTRRIARSIQRSARGGLLLTASCTCLLAAIQAVAQSEGFRIIQPTPGGIDPHPYITSASEANGLKLEWFGFQGPYQVQRSTDVVGAPWANVGNPTTGNSATVPLSSGNYFHRIVGGNPNYLGIAVCTECHADKAAGWTSTRHGNAFNTLKKIGQQNNPQCVICHTVGSSVRGGFASEAATPHLLNVQCENCHGPAGNHVASGEPPITFPVTTRSPMLCGGCHNGFHHPTYDEWFDSGHHAVIQELVGEFSSADRTAAINRMNTCGSCHSGGVRLAMLRAYNSSTSYTERTNVMWPSAYEATNTPVSCIVCHESHGVHVYTNVLNGIVYTNQLRNPLTSTNVYSYSTGTNFASQYNAKVSVCGQCHNARGAVVSFSSRPPHYSPQYNLFLGVIGVTASSTPPQGAHKDNPRQCAGCHTHRHNETNPDPNNPVYTGHTFRPTIEACQACHTDPSGPGSATNRLFTTQAEVSGMMATTKNLLDIWATTKNTNSWASKYEARGWEYTTPGELSNPSGSTSIVGPTAAEQAQIPQGIKDARFNLYLISRDKSKGIHNAPYTRHLLQTAQQRVNAELAR